VSTLGGQVHRFSFPAGRPGDRHQPLRRQALERGGDVALIVGQGAHEFGLAGGHAATGPLVFGGQPDQDTPLQA
jgi:hypothetical protein